MKLLLAAALILLPFVISPVQVMACSCMAPGSASEELSKSSAVFSGTVTGIQSIGNSKQITLNIDRSWKGDVASSTKVSTGMDSAGCGFEFEVGSSYLVYATQSEGELYTGLCSRTALLSSASADVLALGEPVVSSAPTANRVAPILVATLAVAVMGVGALGLVYIIRKSRV